MGESIKIRHVIHVVILFGSDIALELNIRHNLVALEKQVNGVINGFSTANELLIVIGEVSVELRDVIVEFDHLMIEIVKILLKNSSGGSAIYRGKMHDYLEEERCVDDLVKVNS